MALNKLGLVLHTFSNVSIDDHNKGFFVLKTTGISYEDLKP